MKSRTSWVVAVVFVVAAPLFAMDDPANEIQNGWRAFNDPLLNRVVEQVKQENLDIQVANARVREAKAAAQTPRAGLWPSISLVGSLARGNTISIKDASINRLGIQGSWALDFFGEAEFKVKAADARLDLQAAALEDARQRVISELVAAVIRWRENRMVVQLMSDQIRELDIQVALQADLVTAGLSDALPVLQTQSTKSQLDSKLLLVEAEVATAIYQIDQLVGSTDNRMVAELVATAPVQIELPVFKTVLAEDVAVLQNRPDVREARAALAGAGADFAQAEAALWPEVSVGGLYEVQSVTEGVLQNGAQVWSVNADFKAPIFNFGQLQSLADAANARNAEAVSQYQSTLKKALQSLRTAVVSYTQSMESVTAWQASVRHQHSALSLARDQFQAGFTNYISRSAVEIEYLQTRIGATQQYGNAARSYIELQRALGSAY